MIFLLRVKALDKLTQDQSASIAGRHAPVVAETPKSRSAQRCVCSSHSTLSGYTSTDMLECELTLIQLQCVQRKLKRNGNVPRQVMYTLRLGCNAKRCACKQTA